MIAVAKRFSRPRCGLIRSRPSPAIESPGYFHTVRSADYKWAVLLGKPPNVDPTVSLIDISHPLLARKLLKSSQVLENALHQPQSGKTPRPSATGLPVSPQKLFP